MPGPARQNRWKTGLPDLPRHSCAARERGTRRWGSSSPRSSRGSSRSRPVLHRGASVTSLRMRCATRTGQRLHVSRHPCLSAREPAGGCGSAAARVRRTRMTPRRAARASTLALLAAAWAVAALLLWRSSVVPRSLHLPHLDEHRYFTASQLRQTASFGRFTSSNGCSRRCAELAALAVYSTKGVRFARESAAGRLGTGMLLGMLGFALVWAVQLPFGVADLWWQRRHHLTHVGYLGHIFGDWLALGGRVRVPLPRACDRHGSRTEASGSLVGCRGTLFIGLALLFAFVNPYLLTTHRLNDPRLRAAAARLERIEHIRHIPVVVEDVHDVTSLPNAEATGLGPSRRVVLWDTMVSEFTPREVTVVIGHELGHLAHNHIWKDIGWYALFAFPGALPDRAAHAKRGGMAQPEAVPLSLFVLVVLTLTRQPIQNAISRHMEAEADWSALQATRDPSARRSCSVTSSRRRSTSRTRRPWSTSCSRTIRRSCSASQWRRPGVRGTAGRPRRRPTPSRRTATCRARVARAAPRAIPARRRGRARAPRSGRHRGSSRAGAR